MEIQLSWRHMEHSPELEAKVRTKLAKIEKFSERMSSMEIIFTKESSRFSCEIQIKLEKAPSFVVKDEGYELTEVMDACLDRAKRKIKEYESRTRERKKSSNWGNERSPDSEETE